MKHMVFFVYYHVEPFGSYALPIDDGSTEVRRNLRLSPAKFFWGRVKNSQVFRLDPTPNLRANFAAIRSGTAEIHCLDI